MGVLFYALQRSHQTEGNCKQHNFVASLRNSSERGNIQEWGVSVTLCCYSRNVSVAI
jgi:hypothetical protein